MEMIQIAHNPSIIVVLSFIWLSFGGSRIASNKADLYEKRSLTLSTKTNLILDITIFSVFLAVSNPAITGLAVHEWLSVAFIAALVTHILFHWEWIATLLMQFFKKLFHSSRLNFVVDSLLFVAMISVMLSGILVSRVVAQALGLNLAAGPAWRSIHSVSADATLVLMALHFALHWKWVVSSVNRYVAAPLIGLIRRPAARTAPVRENN